MADQMIGVTSGFYDAVNRDRLYTAAQMNMPYKRLISNGVFATPSGTASTDLQVSAGSGRTVRVAEGNALFGDRWFENPAVITITVPANSNLVSRIDSVIAQVNVNSASRAGSIVYRTGTAASNPSPPALSTDSGVYEYRLANVTVAAGATSIIASNITDCRGSAECPWVTSLIYQVDTSTLWTQYQAAYQAYFNTGKTNMEDYIAAQKQAWEEFLAEASGELSVTPSVMTLQASRISGDSQDTFLVNIASFDPDTDALMVYVNGDLARDWTLSGSSVVLNAPLAEGNTVTFVCFKSIVTAELDSVVSLIRRLDDKVAGAISDSGWMSAVIESPCTGTVQARKLGSQVYIRGSVTGYDDQNATIGAVPLSMAPSEDQYVQTIADSSPAASAYLVLKIASATGAITVASYSQTISPSDAIHLDCSYISDSGYGIGMVWSYQGSVATYADLPTDVAIGDVYMVLAASEYNAERDCVLWNGSSWEIVATTITSAEIDDVLNDVF